MKNKTDGELDKIIAEWMGWTDVRVRFGIMADSGPMVMEHIKEARDDTIEIMSGIIPSKSLECALPTPEYCQSMDALWPVFEKLRSIVIWRGFARHTMLTAYDYRTKGNSLLWKPRKHSEKVVEMIDSDELKEAVAKMIKEQIK